jgi:hypothetical protein
MPMSFQLSWHDRRVGPGQTPRRFLDFVVDGQSLYERFADNAQAPYELYRADTIGCLGWLGPEADADAASRLLGEAPPDIEDRVAIYVCPECADLFCGAVTARVERDGDEVVWRKFGWSEFNWTADRWEHEPCAEWPELRFAADEYAEAIQLRSQSPGP